MCWSPKPDSGLACIGRWSYGPSYKVSVHATASDTLVLLTRGSGATIARFRSADSVTIEPLGEIDCHGIPHRAVLVDTLVCVGVQRGGTGLEVFGVADPTNPHRLASVPLPSVNDIAVADSLVYLACADDTLRVFSIADPRDPVRVGACRDSSDLAMCYADGYCYLVHSSGVNIVDVRDPSSPHRAGRIAGHAPMAVQVRDSICCLTTESDGFLVFNVSDPSAPQPLGTLSLPDAEDLHIPETCDTVAYTSYLHVVSIANPSSPRLVGQLASPGWDEGVAATPALGHALLADRYDGVVVFDIGDPTTPAIDTMALAAGVAFDIALDNGRAYLASRFSGLTVLDVSDPARPSVLGSYDTVGQVPVSCGAVVARDSMAYLSWPRPRMLSIDVSDPTRPQRAGGCEGMANQPEDMVLRDSLLYCAEASRFQVVNVARPREPELVGNCVAGDATSAGLSVRDTLAFVGNYVSQVVNTADPTSPVVVGTFNRGAWNVVPRDTFAFVSSGGIIVYSIADPTQPRAIDSISLGPNTYWVEAVGNLLYTGNRDGVHVVDASDVHNMREVGYCSTPYTVKRVHHSSPYIYASCWDAGVCIFESTQVAIAEPYGPRLPEVQHFRVEPSPAVSHVKLAGLRRTPERLMVRDVAGRVVMMPSSGRSTGPVIDVSELPSGLYFVEALMERKRRVAKFVKR
jgi:hypothetical protein